MVGWLIVEATVHNMHKISFNSKTIQVPICAHETQRVREVSRCPALRSTNPQLGFQMCVCA